MSEQHSMQAETEAAVVADRLDALEARLDALDARLDALAERFEGLPTRVDQPETTAASRLVSKELRAPPNGDSPGASVQPQDGGVEVVPQPVPERRHQPLMVLCAILAAVFLGVGLVIAIFGFPVRLSRTGQSLILLAGGLCAAAYIIIGSLGAAGHGDNRER